MTLILRKSFEVLSKDGGTLNEDVLKVILNFAILFYLPHKFTTHSETHSYNLTKWDETPIVLTLRIG